MLKRGSPAPRGGGNRARIGFAAERRLDTTIAPSAATRATWGEPATAQQPRRMALRRWRPMHRATLRGFADIELPSGLVLHDVAIFAGRNGPWASLPSKPVLDQDGRHRINIAGKPQYAPVAEWRSRELADRFSADVTELVRAAHPDALDGGGAMNARGRGGHRVDGVARPAVR
jgi:hypothetical protein